MTALPSHTETATAAAVRIGDIVRWVDTDTTEQRTGYVTALDEVSGQARINTALGVYHSAPIDALVTP